MDTAVKIQSLLKKSSQPLSSIQLQIQIFGMFSLPQAWKPGQIQPPDYNYQLTLSGLQFPNGKPKRRQLTQQELQGTQDAKKGKSPVKKKGDPDPTPEQLQQLERKKKQRMEVEQKLRDQWENLDQQTKFYSQMEDIFKNPCIQWQDQNYTPLVLSHELVDTELQELEQAVEDLGGTFMEFAKLPKLNQEEAKKRAKAKGAEDLKPTYGKAWVDLSQLQEPGKEEIEVRVKLEDSPIANEEQPELIFLDTNCYVYLRIKTTPSITPVLDSQEEDFQESPNLYKFPSTQNSSFEFRKQIKLATRKIAQQYHQMFAEQMADNQRKLAVSRQKELRESRKQNFLYQFNLSGKASELVDLLRKSVIEIARQKFRKEGKKGMNKQKFLSELYSYLIEQVNLTIDQAHTEMKQSLHQDIIIPKQHYQREKQHQITQSLKQTPDQRLSRLAGELEMQENIERAIKCHNQRIVRDSSNISIFLDYARFSLRNGDLARAEEALYEILSLSGPEVQADKLLLLGSVLLQRRRFNEAALYIHTVLQRDFFHFTAHMIAGLLYRLWQQPVLQKKHMLIAKRLVMRHLGLLPPKRGQRTNIMPSMEGISIRSDYQPGQYAKSLNTDQVDDMHYALAEYFLKEKLIELASQTLGQIFNKETSIQRYSFCCAQIYFWKKEYQSCLQVINELLSYQTRNQQAWVLKGNALFITGNGFDAQECFLKAIRFSSRGAKSSISGSKNTMPVISDYSILLKMGKIYLKRRAWKDAKAVLSKCCQDSPTSSSWQGLGLACLQLDELNEAEDALNQANLMDEENPDTWLALALLCLKSTQQMPGRYQQYIRCLEEALRLSPTNERLLMFVGNENLVKFFLTGVEGYLEKYQYGDALVCFQLAHKILVESQRSVDYLVENVMRKFEEIKSTEGATERDYQEIEKAKQTILSSFLKKQFKQKEYSFIKSCQKKWMIKKKNTQKAVKEQLNRDTQKKKFQK